MPSQCPSQCWLFVKWILKNIFQWDCDPNATISVENWIWKCYLQNFYHFDSTSVYINTMGIHFWKLIHHVNGMSDIFCFSHIVRSMTSNFCAGVFNKNDFQIICLSHTHTDFLNHSIVLLCYSMHPPQNTYLKWIIRNLIKNDFRLIIWPSHPNTSCWQCWLHLLSLNFDLLTCQF